MDDVEWAKEKGFNFRGYTFFACVESDVDNQIDMGVHAISFINNDPGDLAPSIDVFVMTDYVKINEQCSALAGLLGFTECSIVSPNDIDNPQILYLK